MKHTLLITLLLLLGGSNNKEEVKVTCRTVIQSSNTIINLKAVDAILRNNSYTGRQRGEVMRITYPLFSHIINKASKSYKLSNEELIRCIQVIAVSESSNSIGHPYSNSLYNKRNNPFGIQGGKDPISTVEYYDGVRTPMELSFMSFNNQHEAISYIINNLFERDRYKILHESKTPLQFFKDMKTCGYYTAPEYYNTFIHIYKQQ